MFVASSVNLTGSVQIYVFDQDIASGTNRRSEFSDTFIKGTPNTNSSVYHDIIRRGGCDEVMYVAHFKATKMIDMMVDGLLNSRIDEWFKAIDPNHFVSQCPSHRY